MLSITASRFVGLAKLKQCGLDRSTQSLGGLSVMVHITHHIIRGHCPSQIRRLKAADRSQGLSRDYRSDARLHELRFCSDSLFESCSENQLRYLLMDASKAKRLRIINSLVQYAYVSSGPEVRTLMLPFASRHRRFAIIQNL